MIYEKFSLALFLAMFSFGVVCHAQSTQPADEGDISGDIFRGLAIPNEPSIHAKCAGKYEAFRIFEYAGMSPIAIIRTELEQSGPRLHIRQFESGRSSAVETVDLNVTQWAELVDVFETSGFWTLESDPDVWMPDSWSWIIEACHKGRFHLIQLYPERDFRMNDVFEHMVQLAPLGHQ